MRLRRWAKIFGALAITMSMPALADTKSSGSGFAIAGGSLIVTANHVVQGCTTIEVPGVGAAVLFKSDPGADLAILRVSRSLAAGLRFRSGHPVRLGEEIIVIGFPLRGLLLSSPPTVTTGIVSSLTGIRDDRTQMQISAPVQPGNSGGPVAAAPDFWTAG
jgi:S1-C subfamily serine protease